MIAHQGDGTVERPPEDNVSNQNMVKVDIFHIMRRVTGNLQ